MDGVSLACTAVDFSTRGFRFSTGTDLVPSHLLNINIGIGDCFTTYLLRGEIRFNVSYGIIQQYIQYQPIRF